MIVQGVIYGMATLRVIKSHYIQVVNKSDADQKEVKALLGTKRADVRVTMKVEKPV